MDSVIAAAHYNIHQTVSLRHAHRRKEKAFS